MPTTAECPKCGGERKRTNGNGKYQCASCKGDWQRRRRAERPGAHRPLAEKPCSRCGETLPAAEFHLDPEQVSGLASWCKPCQRAANRASYRKRGSKHFEFLVKESQAVITANRNAAKRGLAATLTLEEWLTVIGDHVDGPLRCAYCKLPAGVDYHLDHVVPLSAVKNPGTVAVNVVPACAPCNQAKAGRSAEEHLAWIARIRRGEE